MDCARYSLPPENTIERHRYGDAGWLVWGGIILRSRTDLHVQSVTMTGHISGCPSGKTSPQKIVSGVKSQDPGDQFTDPKREIRRSPNVPFNKSIVARAV
ncbi:DDE_3 domain-containing protein [Trichonephila clavipes]|nr:DDE_3 domain-containing protein [Trichonephila clavipes]